MVSELLQKYIWLINTFIRHGERGVTLDELCNLWDKRFGQEYSRSSFNNHRNAIAEVFGIEIQCNRRTKRYFIRYGEDIMDTDASTAWMINTFTVNSMLSLGKERLSGRVSVEEIPSGHKFLSSVMEAMTENREIEIQYRKYSDVGISTYTLKPYALKENARRWYIVAWCNEKSQIRVYGMDRIVDMKVSESHFNMPENFDVDDLFRNSFGVYLSDNTPVEIIIKASLKESRYLEDLPIHHSQKVIYKSENSVTFSIFATLNRSLTMELLRLGPGIEVVMPEALRNEVAALAESTAEIYRKPDMETI